MRHYLRILTAMSCASCCTTSSACRVSDSCSAGGRDKSVDSKEDREADRNSSRLIASGADHEAGRNASEGRVGTADGGRTESSDGAAAVALLGPPLLGLPRPEPAHLPPG